MAIEFPFIGIDFGTCNSSMAWFNPKSGLAEILKNAEGEEKTPSLVYFGKDEILVGKLAENAISDEEMRPFVYPPGAKRDIGKKTRVLALGNRQVRPQDVAVEVIRKLKQDAEEFHFQAEVPRAVITVPATFDQLEQERIQEAGHRAGFQEVVLMEEPVSAALAYTHDGYQVGHHVMVFDLGGGTFDLALLARDGEPDQFMLAQEPRGLRKGGEDFDLALYTYVEREAQKEGRSLSRNGLIDLEILRHCRDRKENLSAGLEALFSSLLPDGRAFRYRLKRATLETLIRDTVAEMVEQAEKMLDLASGSGHRIDAVVLVGGSSRVPLVAALLQERMPVKAQRWHQQDVAVALGAAYHAEMLWGTKSSETSPPTKRDDHTLSEVVGIPPVNAPGTRPPIKIDDYSLVDVVSSPLVTAPETRPPINWDADDDDMEGAEEENSSPVRESRHFEGNSSPVRELCRFEGHTSAVWGVAFSPDGHRALSGGNDRTVRLWDVATGRELCRFEGHTRAVWGVAFSPDGHRALSGSSDGTVRLWDVATGRELRRFERHSNNVRSVAFSPDGHCALSCGDDKDVHLWDVETGRELRRLEGHSDIVTRVAFSPDGHRALSSGSDTTIRLSEPATGREPSRLRRHTVSVFGVAFSPDGHRALSGGSDRTVRLWDVATGRELCRFEGHTSAVWGVAFSPDDHRALSGGSDRTVRLWDVATGRELCRFEGHTSAVWRVAFSPDGHCALSSGSDRTVRLWDVAMGCELHRFDGHSDHVHSVAFSPDGRRVLSGSADKTVRLWGLPPSSYGGSAGPSGPGSPDRMAERGRDRAAL